MNEERIPSEIEKYNLFLAYKAESLGMSLEEFTDIIDDYSRLNDNKNLNAFQREFMEWDEKNYPRTDERYTGNNNTEIPKFTDPVWEMIKAEETSKAKEGR